MASASNERTCLKLSDKVKIIEEVAQGARVTQLAKKYGVSKATICKIKRLKTQILRRTCDTLGGTGNRQTLKNPKAPMMENCLYKWFLEQREDQVLISGEIIKEKAKLLNEKLKECENFVASDGWLQRFKRRYGIRLMPVSGGKLSVRQKRKRSSVVLTEEMKLNILVYVEENPNTPFRTLAKIFGISTTSVFKTLKEFNYKAPTKKEKVIKPDIDKKEEPDDINNAFNENLVKDSVKREDSQLSL
ncbi:hypothetical protein Trydic_g18669 [Trypoxylus dichotomus]